jgi:hypothetical protein
MRYRKRPLEVEAVQWLGELRPIHDLGAGYTQVGKNLFLQTLEGSMIVNPGAWVVKGIKGEFYPVRDDIFRATYEEVVHIADHEWSEGCPGYEHAT